MLTELLLLTTAALLSFYFWMTAKYDYWEKRGVKYVKPRFIFGNFWDTVFVRKNRPAVYKELYDAGVGEPFVGIIQVREPALVIRDPEVLRCILVKDFNYFHDRDLPFNEKRDPLSAHLFNLDGPRWRAIRTKLTPTFTSGKMKNMLPLMQECADEMVTVLDVFAEQEEVVDMREVLSRYSTDVIGTCIFGVQCNSLRNPDAEFRKMGAMFFKPSILASTLKLIEVNFPALAKILPIYPEFKKLHNFFFKVITDTIRFREEHNVYRKDFLDLLIQIHKKGTITGNADEMKEDAFVKNMGNMKIEDFEFTETLLAAQALVFFIAGFETSSSTISNALVELSRHPELQQKLREEIDETFERENNKFTYHSLMKMPYMDKVVSEILRMYPSLPIIFRNATERYKIPGHDVVLEKGMRVYVPIYALHRDPEIYPDPEKFDPERFTEEAKQSRPNYTFIPFGEGPRNCIGQRFGLLQTKLGLSILLRNFEFEMGPQMEYPPEISRSAFVLITANGIHLRIRRRADFTTY